MARITREQRLANVHQQALKEFDLIFAAVREERKQCMEDRRFYSIAGAQWEGSLGQQFENKPRFEVNKVHLAVIRIINEYRNNRITVDFVPKSGSGNEKLADACDGLYRADEQDSVAEEAYDNAFEEAVGGGFGAWRLTTKYEDEESEENESQRICIEPIFDADSSVFFDLNAKRQDKADAQHAFVITAMTRGAYEEAYGDTPESWPHEAKDWEFDWSTPDYVYVAEYYRVEEASVTISIWQGLAGEEERYEEADFEADPDLEERLRATGFTEARRRKIKRKRVHKYILSGGGVLEDAGLIAGKNIPIVPLYAKRWVVDGTERMMGHVRLAKDAQRLKNMQLSKLAEISAYSSIEKPIFTGEQVSGHQTMWAEDNVKNYPFLLVNSISDANGNVMPSGPIGYTKVPNIPPAMAAALQITEQDMQDILGNQQAGEAVQPNISGKAIELIQNKLDMQAFIYMSNMAKAVKRSGAIWLSMAQDIFVEKGRKLKTVGPRGELGTVELMKPGINEETRAVEVENDLSKATFDVVADVGPSSSSKRASTVRALTGMLQMTADPETQQVLSAMALMNMEGEGLSEANDYFRNKLVMMGVVKPTPEEQQQIDQAKANQQPDANTQYLLAAAEQAQADATKSRADTVYTIARAEESRAKTMETISKIDASQQQQALEVIDRFGQQPQTQQPVTFAGSPTESQ